MSLALRLGKASAVADYSVIAEIRSQPEFEEYLAEVPRRAEEVNKAIQSGGEPVDVSLRATIVARRGARFGR
jgi:hypothetical protein